MLNKFFTICAIILSICGTVEAAMIEKYSTVAVMDFEPHKGTSSTDLNLMNAEKTSSEYVLYRLVETKKFRVIDRELFQDKLGDLKVSGIIDPITAKKIGEILGVQYIIYGNVTDVTVATDNLAVNANHVSAANVNRVRAHLTARIMDVETGRIVMAARGEGQSESAFLGYATEKIFTIGTVKVSQDSVHNALKKAAFQAVDILTERLFGENKANKI